jgi:hypothetical protein
VNPLFKEKDEFSEMFDLKPPELVERKKYKKRAEKPKSEKQIERELALSHKILKN